MTLFRTSFFTSYRAILARFVESSSSPPPQQCHVLAAASYYSSNPVTQHPQSVKDDIPHTTTTTTRNKKHENEDVSEKIKRSLDDDDGRDYSEGVYTAATDDTRKKNYRSSGEDMSGFVADTAKSGVKKTVETAFKIGEAAAETMEGSWGVAKETTKKIRKTVLDGSDDDEEENDQQQRGGGGGTSRRKKMDQQGGRRTSSSSSYDEYDPLKRQRSAGVSDTGPTYERGDS